MAYGVIERYLNKDLPPYEKNPSRINDNNFFIPTYDEYYLLFKYNYTIPQLKQICKKYKLPRSGSKKILMRNIYNFLELSCSAIKIQKLVRGFLQRCQNRLRGPAFFKREMCVNEYDFFTLESVKDIPSSQFYSMKDNDGFIYGFDILSLWQLFEKTENNENPYNRSSFPKETYKILLSLMKMNKKINVKMTNTIVDMEKQLELRTIDLFQKINTLGNYTDHSWFLELDKNKLIRFCRELYDIWVHRAQISEETKKRIYPNGNPFVSMNINMLHNNTSLYELRKIAVGVSENLVYYGIHNDDKNLGAYYVLSALTLQNSEAANALPWLYQSVM